LIGLPPIKEAAFPFTVHWLMLIRFKNYSNPHAAVCRDDSENQTTAYAKRASQEVTIALAIS